MLTTPMDYFNSSFIEDLNQSIDINHGEDSQRKNTKEHEKNVKGVCEPMIIWRTFYH